MTALELDKIIHHEEALQIVMGYGEGNVSFREFSGDLIDLLDKIAEEDFNEILNSYSVPAERIIKSLK